MAKNHSNKPDRSPSPARGGWRAVRYCLALLLLGAVALCWLSLLTYSPNDPPSPAVYPPQKPANAAGVAGAYIAHLLRYWIGGGVYMGVTAATAAAIIMIAGGKITALPWRAIGVAILMTTTSAAVHMLKPVTGDGVTVGPAGVIGTAAGEFLLSRFAHAGAWLIVVISLCVGLLLAAESLVLNIPRLGRKAWAKGKELPSAFAALRLQGRPAEKPAKPLVRPAATPAATTPAKTAAPASAAPPRPAPLRPAPPPTPPRMPQPVAGGEPPPKSPPPGDYKLPSQDLLAAPAPAVGEVQESAALEKKAILQQTLNDFGVAAEVVGHMTGPVITMFELSLAPGVKVSQIGTLANDIARALAVPGVRVVSPLPGKDTIGVEVPNLRKEIVRIRELMNAAPDADKQFYLPLYIGKDAAGGPIVADLASMPHMLIAGTTGSGKSVCINSIIMTMLMTRTPEQVRLILIDPKMVEMAAFENVPHLMCPIVNDMRRAEDILDWAATKMDERYELFKEACVKNIAGYNRLTKEEICQRLGVTSEEERKLVQINLPYYVIIIDELADLIMTSSKEVEGYIIRIAQKARAVGIHLILATQRPSANVVTSLIKSNMPCRISFRVASRLESRIVLDQNGAEVLLGQGDMLFLQPGTSSLIRAQGSFVDDAEIRGVVKALRKAGQPQYCQELMRLGSPTGEGDSSERDELFDQAVEIVLSTQRGSVSLLQRRLQVGYSRASRIIDQMAEAGLLGDYKGSQARECLVTLDQWQANRASIIADQTGESALNGEPTSL